MDWLTTCSIFQLPPSQRPGRRPALPSSLQLCHLAIDDVAQAALHCEKCARTWCWRRAGIALNEFYKKKKLNCISITIIKKSGWFLFSADPAGPSVQSVPAWARQPSPNQIYYNDHSNGQRNGPCSAWTRRLMGTEKETATGKDIHIEKEKGRMKFGQRKVGDTSIWHLAGVAYIWHSGSRCLQ